MATLKELWARAPRLFLRQQEPTPIQETTVFVSVVFEEEQEKQQKPKQKDIIPKTIPSKVPVVFHSQPQDQDHQPKDIIPKTIPSKVPVVLHSQSDESESEEEEQDVPEGFLNAKGFLRSMAEVMGGSPSLSSDDDENQDDDDEEEEAFLPLEDASFAEDSADDEDEVFLAKEVLDFHKEEENETPSRWEDLMLDLDDDDDDDDDDDPIVRRRLKIARQLDPDLQAHRESLPWTFSPSPSSLLPPPPDEEWDTSSSLEVWRLSLLSLPSGVGEGQGQDRRPRAKKGKGKNKKGREEELTEMVVDMREVALRMRRFVVEERDEDLFEMPPMRKTCRKAVARMADLFGLEVQRTKRKGRAVVVKRGEDERLPSLPDLETLIAHHEMSLADRLGPSPKALSRRSHALHSSSAPSLPFSRSLRPKTGSVVGEHAAPIAESNIGNRLLRGMGWTGGVLGSSPSSPSPSSSSSSDLLNPILVTVKADRCGLGF